MGKEIVSHKFRAKDYQQFKDRLLENLEGLKLMLRQPGFGVGAPSIGAELELYLVDKAARPLLLNREVIERSGHPQLALELNRFNLEYNLAPQAAKGSPFTQLEREMESAIKLINQQLLNEQGSALPIGILPTLKRSDFGLKTITNGSRFHALTQALQTLRGRMFQIYIEGDPPLSLRSHDVSLEGANSSMQVHYRVTPDRFADTFNAFQMITPVMVALASNSAFMLGQKLWHETRIPLFRQTIDGRSKEECNRGLPSRVCFGNGWVREGAYELFSEMVHLYQPILPICTDDDSRSVIQEGKIAPLTELRMHSGSVWPWNRAVFDPDYGGHLRIELRALPAGPTSSDMAANAAFFVGVAQGLNENMPEIIPTFPFSVLKNDFYEAARKGLNADLMWPDLIKRGGLRKQPVKEIALQLLEVAEDGLQQIGVDDSEIAHYLGLIEERVCSGITGAIWQRKEYERRLTRMSKTKALTQMVQCYMEHSAENVPVSRWRAKSG